MGDKWTTLPCIYLYVFLHLTTLASCKQCPPLLGSRVENGHIKRWSSTKIEVICDRSYIVYGSATLFCHQGEWTGNGKLPQCTLRSRFCKPAPNLEHGRKTGRLQHVGASVMYTCDPGYTLVGSRVLQCAYTLRWRPQLPKCLDYQQMLAETSKLFEEGFVEPLVVRNITDPSRLRILGPDVNVIGLDLVFLVDRSSSIDPVDFRRGMNFIKALVEEFGVKNGNNIKGGTRVALITFGDQAEIVFNLNDEKIKSVRVAHQRIDAVKASGGSTSLVSAIDKFIVRVKSVARPEVKKALFIMTDGKPNVDRNRSPSELVEHLKTPKIGWELFTVGIGRHVNETLLREMASSPKLNHNFYFDKFSDFERIMWLIRNKATPAPPPGPEKCGYISPSDDRWPWLVSLWSEVPQQKLFTFKQCTGVLICRKWVMTAAHCLHYYDKRDLKKVIKVFVTVGQKDLAKWNANSKNFMAAQIITHEKFNETSLENDIALIRLPENVAYSDNVKIACLPRKEVQLSRHTVRNSSVAGWGSIQDKTFDEPALSTKFFSRNQVDLSFIPARDCARKAMKMSCTPPANSQYCAETKGDRKKDCMSGTGSPAVMTDSSGYDEYQRLRVVGILSSDCKCTEKGFHIYTRVFGYLQWLTEKTGRCIDEHY